MKMWTTEHVFLYDLFRFAIWNKMKIRTPFQKSERPEIVGGFHLWTLIIVKRYVGHKLSCEKDAEAVKKGIHDEWKMLFYNTPFMEQTNLFKYGYHKFQYEKEMLNKWPIICLGEYRCFPKFLKTNIPLAVIHLYRHVVAIHSWLRISGNICIMLLT